MAGVGAIRSARESQPRLEPEHGVQPRDAHALPVPAVGDTTFSLLSDLLGSTAGQQYGGRGHDDPDRSISTPEIYPSVDVCATGRTVCFLPKTNRGYGQRS